MTQAVKKRYHSTIQSRLSYKPRLIGIPISAKTSKVSQKKQQRVSSVYTKYGADLWKKKNKYEVKGFVLNSAPISFSPALDFKSIFFLNAEDIINGNFILYRVKIDSKKFKNLKVNLKFKFKDLEYITIKPKPRPRRGFKWLLQQLREQKIDVDFYLVTVDIEKETISVNKLFFPI